MIGLIGQGVGFGFTAGVSPGPLQTFLISTTLSRGWRRGMLVTFAPILSDAPIIVLMTVLLHQLPEVAVRGIRVAGGLFVLWLAWSTWQALRSGDLMVGKAKTDEEGENSRTLVQAVLMNMLNPNPYIFWGSVTGPILIAALDDSILHAVVFLVGFYGVFWLMNVALVMVFNRLRQLDDRVTRGALQLSIVVLGILGVVLLYQGISG